MQEPKAMSDNAGLLFMFLSLVLGAFCGGVFGYGFGMEERTHDANMACINRGLSGGWYDGTRGFVCFVEAK